MSSAMSAPVEPHAPNDPRLPRMVQIGTELAPAAPSDIAETGVEESVLYDLALKLANTVPQFNTNWAAGQLRLPLRIVEPLLDQLRANHLLEVLGQSGLFGYRYAITGQGSSVAARLMEISGYIGPAPVSLAAYTAMTEWQVAQFRPPAPEHVAGPISVLVLDDEQASIAGLAVSSGRSLFLFGPPGNGKTTLGKLLHQALRGELWIPYCIGLDNNIINLHDPQCHEPAPLAAEPPGTVDHRWVRVKRPLLIVGGELALSSVDLVWSPSLRYYEAPLQLKANGGTFLLDDFGRQRFDPHQLLNRWIVPLEHQHDYLTLVTGQKITVPFRLMLIISTNLDPELTMDPAFLRRMGYRLNLEAPTREHYSRIFHAAAEAAGSRIEPRVLDRVLERYRLEGREYRGSEPRDLIERCGDICRFGSMPLTLDEEVLDLAWAGYFGIHSASRPRLADTPEAD